MIIAATAPATAPHGVGVCMPDFRRLEVLKNDKRAIFTASAHAHRAADYLHGLQQTVDGRGRRLGGPSPLLLTRLAL